MIYYVLPQKIHRAYNSMKAKIWILFLTYSINIPYKYGDFYIKLLIKFYNYGQNCSQFKMAET